MTAAMYEIAQKKDEDPDDGATPDKNEASDQEKGEDKGTESGSEN
jgi:hypothetical protein